MDEQEYELKHWGILGMKWGVRNYQNEDGSLTPLGRIRYGVGPAKGKTGNAMGVNDAGSLSDEELRRMTKRYKQQADYYRARNEYIQQENYFEQNTNPPKKQSAVGKFISNVFGRPIENVMTKNFEFLLGMGGYELLKSENPELAAQYLKSVTGGNFDYKTKDPIKEAAEKAYQQAQLYKNMNDLEEAKRKNEDIKSGKYDKDRETKEELERMALLAKNYSTANNLDKQRNIFNERAELEDYDKSRIEQMNHFMDRKVEEIKPNKLDWDKLVDSVYGDDDYFDDDHFMSDDEYYKKNGQKEEQKPNQKGRK